MSIRRGRFSGQLEEGALQWKQYPIDMRLQLQVLVSSYHISEFSCKGSADKEAAWICFGVIQRCFVGPIKLINSYFTGTCFVFVK